MAYPPEARLVVDRIASNGDAEFLSDELVIAMPYANLVTRKLVKWQAAPTSGQDDADPRLGLVKVSLRARQAVGYLQHAKPRLYDQGVAAARAEGQAPNDLDIVVRCLRLSFARKYMGWCPTFGKNRVVKRLRGSYVIDGGGGGGLDKFDGYVIDGGGNNVLVPVDAVRVPPRLAAPGAGARVGIIDTRLYPHAWLAGAYAATAGDLILEDPPERQDRIQHATFVTGMVLRQAPGARVELHAGLRDDASSDTWTIARIIADLAAAEIDVLNLSFGCTTEDARPPLVLSTALEILANRTVVVAAAGNQAEGGRAKPVWPAACDEVIAVGALGVDGTPADFSPVAPWVDVFAPGVDVVSTCNPGADNRPFARWSGTSFAAAAVTGAIAARVTGCHSARSAWNAIRDTQGARCEGRPIVGLDVPANWPPDFIDH